MAKAKKPEKFRPQRSDFNNLGSLITFKVPGKELEQCVGDLMHFEGRGTYDPSLGLVDVTKEEADAHNKALSEARLTGLDDNCDVGQGGFFYFKRTDTGYEVNDFIGTVISTDVQLVHGSSVTFKRKAKTFRGRLDKNSDAFNFQRIA